MFEKKFLLDADILIDIQRDYEPAMSWFASLKKVPYVPGLVVMEMIQDAQNAQQVKKAIKFFDVSLKKHYFLYTGVHYESKTLPKMGRRKNSTVNSV